MRDEAGRVRPPYSSCFQVGTTLQIKPGKEESPAGLTRVQSFGFSEVFEVAMVRNYLKLVVSSLQPVSPLLQGQFDGQQFPVTDIIIPLRRGQLFGEGVSWKFFLNFK